MPKIKVDPVRVQEKVAYYFEDGARQMRVWNRDFFDTIRSLKSAETGARKAIYSTLDNANLVRRTPNQALAEILEYDIAFALAEEVLWDNRQVLHLSAGR